MEGCHADRLACRWLVILCGRGLLAKMNDARPPTALLPVRIREDRALLGDSIKIWRAVPHQTYGVGANLRDADVVAEDHEDVGFLSLLRAEFSTR